MAKKPKNKKVLVIHGPNLHMLGKREPEVYGTTTLTGINARLKKLAGISGIQIEIFQSNSEGDLVEKITACDCDFLIINPAAYTHTSVAIRDALLSARTPAIEVHLSNIYKREEFRKTSLVSDVVVGTISGFGSLSYELAFQAAVNFLAKK